MMFPEGRERVHWEQMGSRAQVPDNASADPIIISGEQGKWNSIPIERFFNFTFLQLI